MCCGNHRERAFPGEAIWTDGAGRRVLPTNRWMWVEVKPNVYIPEADVASFDRFAEAPAICRAFRELDSEIDRAPPEPAPLWCLEWRATLESQPRWVCKIP